MARTEEEAQALRRRRTAIGATTLVVLLAVLVAATSGIGLGLAVLGLAGVVAGIVAAVRGQARWAFIAGRRLGLVVAVAGLAALIVGNAISPTQTKVAADASSPMATVTTTSTAPTRPTALQTTPPAQETTPSVSPTPEAVVTTSQAPVLPPRPVMTMTCPPGGSVASPAFGEQISATAPYSVTIDYGDGDRYTNDDQHLSAIFNHTYRVAGNFTVSALLTDAAGQTVSANCTYGWTKPAPIAHSSTSGTAGGGSSGDYYTNVDGNKVHSPVQAPVAPAGATAQCRDGSWSFSQHHQGTCSGHGGVARWLN